MNIYPLELNNTTQIRVRYAETDKMGFVYNGEYLAYFEVGRVELMRSVGLPYSTLEGLGYQLPLTESHINYKSPAFFEDLLDICAILEFENKPLMKIQYRITREDKLIANGYTVHSFVRADTKKPVKPPKIFIDALTSYKQKISENF